MKALFVFCLILATGTASAVDKIFYVKTQSGTRDLVIDALAALGFQIKRLHTSPDWVSVSGPDRIESLRQIPNVLFVEGEVRFHTLSSTICSTQFE